MATQQQKVRRKHYTVTNAVTGAEFQVGEKTFNEMAQKTCSMDLRNAAPVYFEATAHDKSGTFLQYVGVAE